LSKVLILEDERNLAELLKDLLTLEGFEVYVPHSFQNVIQTADEFSPDAIVMDVFLKELDGLDIIRQLRQNPKYHMLYILALSGLDMAYKAKEAGANDFLQKPFMPDEIVKRLNGNKDS